MVLFSLRVGEVKDLNKLLPMARLRPHVVLQLLFALVDSGFVKLSSSRTVQQLRKSFRHSWLPGTRSMKLTRVKAA